MKPSGIHFKKGMIPDFPYNVYLDLKPPKSFPIPKPRGSPRVNYLTHNYCARCEIKYPKTILRCKECGNPCRTKPWHGRSNFANGGRY